MLFDVIRRQGVRCRLLLRNLFRRTQTDQDLDAELGAYLDLLTAENEQRGMSPAEARRSAQLNLGGITQVKEQIREVQAGAFVETVLQDFRYAQRMFRRSPAFFAVAVSTLALGIDFTTALFSIVNAVVLHPLPYPDAGRLAFLGAGEDKSSPGFVSYPDFQDWQRQNRSFETLAAYGEADTSISNGESAIRTHATVVTQDFFKIFAVAPQIGRDFSPAEHQPGTAPVVLISNSLWRGMFGADPHVVGRTLKLLGGIRCTVIGVMPPGFDFPAQSRIWMVAELTNDGIHERTAHNFLVVGKLRPGVSIATAQGEMSAIARRLKAQFPGTYQTSDAQVMSLQDRLVGPFKTSLWTLFAAVGFVLLIVCVNVANLLLARGTARAHELALRSALGAGRTRLIRQLTVESLVLALAGGAAGVLLARFTLSVLHFVVPVTIPRMETVSINGPVLAFAVAISLLSGLLFGIIPALTAAHFDLNETLKQAAPQHSATRTTRRIGQFLVISEVGLAFLLLVGTGLLIRSFVQLRRQPAGFQPGTVLTAELSFPLTSLNWQAPPPDRIDNYQAIAARVRALPGVRAVAYSSALPLTGDPRDGHFSVEGMADLPGFRSDAKYRVISPNYFRALGTRLLAGRFFTESDGPHTTPVVIINATMARNIFGNGPALGRRIWFDSFDSERRFMTVVGIVEDIREDGLNRPAQAAGYVCYTQHAAQLTDTHLIVQVTASDPLRFAPVIRRIIRSVNPDVPAAFDTLEAIYARSVARQRFETQMLGLFAAVAILLAGIGIYGVLSYLVQQTRTEIGIRMALGASSGSILRQIISHGMRVALLGMLLSMPGVLAMARLVSAMLYNVGVFDPLTYGVAGIALGSVVLLASYFPARRAMRIEPIMALKYD